MSTLIINVSLLLTMSLLIGMYPFRIESWWNRQKVLRGIVLGLLGMLLMSFPYTMLEGAIFDSRTILLAVSGMLFGLIPTAVATAMIAAMRIYQGGLGIVPGITTAFVSALAGVIWHTIRYERYIESSRIPAPEFYLVGVVAHILSWFSMLLYPTADRYVIFKAIALPFLLLYPIITMILGIILFTQLQRIEVMRKIVRSELLFKTIFTKSPVGISRTDLTSGKVLEINESYCRFLGYSADEIVGRVWSEFSLPEDQHISDNATFLLMSGAEETITIDKRFKRKDGRVVWANVTVSPLTIGKDTHESLGMIIDITERKEHEEKLLHISTHDTLTGLFSYNHFEQYVERYSVHPDKPVAIILADVDGLKILNEAFGQSEGNRLLRIVTRILRESTNDSDYLARIGGDEFAIILSDRSEAEYQQIAKELSTKLTAIPMAGGMEMSVSIVLVLVGEGEKTLKNALVEAKKALATRKLFIEAPSRGNLVHTIINALHVRNKREEHHSRRVSFLSEQLGRAVGLSDEEVGQLRLAGLFHDIGKIAIDEELLNKPTPFTDEDRSEMERHVEIGYRLLASVEDMAPIAQIVLAHHERIDGAGYPRKLKGEAIPLQARIIAIADAYDAMTSVRTYQKQISSREAASELKANGGTQFDRSLTKRFIEEVLFLPFDQL